MFVIVNSRGLFYGTYPERVQADIRARELTKEFPGVTFSVYKEIWSVNTPTVEQKANKEFWS